MPGTVGRVTASGQLVTGAGVIYAISVVGEGVLAVVTLYDNTAASGRVLWELETASGAPCNLGGLRIAYSKGIYVSVAGGAINSVVVNYG
jgi:hypothetical protein